MALKKIGSSTKLQVVKNAGFQLDINYLAEIIQKQIPEKKLSVDQLHSSLKSIGVNNYQAEDLSELMNRLQAIGFTISK